MVCFVLYVEKALFDHNGAYAFLRYFTKSWQRLQAIGKHAGKLVTRVGETQIKIAAHDVASDVSFDLKFLFAGFQLALADSVLY